MHQLVRKTLEIYLTEKRLITQSDIPADMMTLMSSKQSVFVTLYMDGRVIASSGRIQCQKENTLYEIIDTTMLCLKDPRFAPSLQSPEWLSHISIRVDVFGSEDRRMIQSATEMDIRIEWLILLSQNHGTMSVILPHMIHLDPTPASYLILACRKAWLDPKTLTHSDYVLYALRTTESTDMV